MRVGRVTLEGATEVNDAGTGERTATIAVDEGSMAPLLVLRDALLATVENTDEPVVPIVIDQWSGYGKVTDASVEHLVADRGIARMSATFEPVANASHPVAVGALSGFLRANPHGVNDPAYHHSVPAAAEVHSWLPQETAVTEVRPTAPGPAAGGVAYRRVSTGGGQTVARWVVAPEHWHQGGCHVETLAGGRWLPVVGRVSLSQPWRAGNGLVRVSLAEAGAEAGRLRCEWWTGSAWHVRDFGIKAGSFDTTAWRAVEVTRMTAHTVTVRAEAVRPSGRTTMTLTLRRGDRNVAISLDTDSGFFHRVRPLPAEAVTEVDNGISTYAFESGTSGGVRWYFTSSKSMNVATASGLVTPSPTTTKQWSMALGVYFPGLSADTGSRLRNILNWFAVQSESVGFS